MRNDGNVLTMRRIISVCYCLYLIIINIFLLIAVKLKNASSPIMRYTPRAVIYLHRVAAVTHASSRSRGARDKK